MSSLATLDNPPDGSIAWAVLAASTGALLLLFGWSVANQDVLVPATAGLLFGGADVRTSTGTETPKAELTLSEKNGTVSEDLDSSALAALQSEQRAQEQAEAAAQAERQATEKAAALLAEQQAEQQAKEERLARIKAEAARVAADQAQLAKQEAEKARLAAEAQAEQERVASQRAAVLRLAAEQQAAEQKAAEEEAARLVALKAEEARQAAEQAEAERIAAEALAAQKQAAETRAREQAEAAKNAQLAAAADQADAANVATAVIPENESPFEKLRREELATLPGLAARIRFLPSEIEPRASSKQPLDRLFELLFLYSETDVLVQIASNEYDIDSNNVLISRERALTLINYLIDRGLEESRFQIRALGKERLPFASHRVTVLATATDQQ